MGRPSSATSQDGGSGGGDDDSKTGNFLCASDCISLYSDDHNGYLSANGFEHDRCQLYHCHGDQKPTKFSDCVFQILPSHSYAGFKALKKHKKKMIAKKAAAEQAAADAAKSRNRKRDEDEDDEEGEKEEVEAEDGKEGGEEGEGYTMHKLMEQHEQEKETNAQMVKDQAGSYISYGMQVQLLHVKSNKFVCMRPKLVAEQERSCSAMDLCAEGGTSGVYFRVESRYKFREQGAPVLKTDEIFLVNPKVDQYIHIANAALPMHPTYREVNASQALKSRLKIVSFAPHDKDAYKYTNGGSIVRLFHPESDTSLCAGYLQKNGKREVGYKGFHGDQSDEIEKLPSMGLWEIEKEKPDEGGPGEWIVAGMPSLFRFRNVATGLYLGAKLPDVNIVLDGIEELDDELDIESDESEEENAGGADVVDVDTAARHELTVDDTWRSQDNLWCLESTSFSGSTVDASAPVRLLHYKSDTYIHAGEAKADKKDTFDGAVASKPSMGDEGLDEHTVQLLPASDDEVNDLYFVLGCIPMLEAYVARCNKIYEKNVEDARPKEVEGPGAPTSVMDLANTVTGDEAAEIEDLMPKEEEEEEKLDAVAKVKKEMAKAKAQGSANPTPADIAMRDNKLSAIEANVVIKTLTDLIFFVTKTESADPYHCEGLPMRSRQKLLREQCFGDILIQMLESPFQGGAKFGPYDLQELLVGQPIISIAQLTYRLLRHMCKDYRRNEFYLAPHIDLFIKQSCETGDDNDLYAEATIAGLLSGNKVLLEEKIDIKNIGLFVDLLMEQDKDARYVDLLTTTCTCQGEAIGSNQETLCELILGNPKTLKELCIRTMLDKKGQPMITFIDYKMNSPTPLQQFLDEGDSEMTDYYVSLLGMFAEICYDRNYKGIYQIEALYQYEVVLACMASQDLDFRLRTRFTRLLLTLHIDREPQVVVQVPNYTRTNTQSTPTMGFVEGETEGGRDFRDIKAFIVEYFKEMAPCQRAWESDKNQMSLNVIEVARFLCAAGFYTVGKDVRSLVNPLVDCMDGTMDQTYPAEAMRPDPKNKLRYQQTEGTVPIMEAKTKMCEILLLLSDIRLDSRITDLLRVYQNSSGEITPQDFNDIFMGGDLDLQQLSDKDVVAILLDLTMYEHSGLVNIAFNNLVHHFTQKQELIQAVERVQLLTDKTLIELHDQVKKDLRRLRSLVETEELWLGEDDPQDRAGELMAILSSLLSHCEEPETDNTPEKGKKKRRKSLTQQAHEDMHADDEEGSRRGSTIRSSTTTPAMLPAVDIKASRELLRNLGAHNAVVEVLELERILLVEGGLDLLCVCHRFLQAFAEDSKSNIEELSQFMDLFMEQLGSVDSVVVTAAAETLAVLGSAELTKELVAACLNGKGHVMTPVPIIDGKACAQCSINLACLNLLRQCIKDEDGKYIKKNQNLVMKVLMDPKRLERGPIQHQWLSDKGSAKLFGNAADEALGSAFSPETLLLEPANVSIVELICECCMGRNGLAQAKCQGIFSLQDLAIHMENLQKHYIIKRPLMNFILRVYLEASHGIGEELSHSTIFKIFTTDIEFVVADDVVDNEESDYLFEGLIPCITNYFRDFVGTAKGSEEQVEMARSILQHLVQLFECCRHNWQKGKVAEIGRTMLRQERLFGSIIQNGEWQPRTSKVQRMFNFHTDEEEEAEEDEEEEVQSKKSKTRFQLAMRALLNNQDIADQAELEFEEMCQALKDIEDMTAQAFGNRTTISFDQLINALVALVDINDCPLSVDLGQSGLKLLRKCVEMENPDSTLPASEWEEEDWEDEKVQEAIHEWQNKMDEVGCVQLIMNLVGQSPDIPIVMDAIDLGITLLLGGNEDVQNGFYNSSRKKGASNFFRRLDELLQQSFEEMKAAGSDLTALSTVAANKKVLASAVAEKEDEEAAPQEEEEDDEEEDDGFDENKNATIVFRFLQLLCEGHNGKCQRMLQAQTAQHVSFDLVQKTLSILRLLCCDMSADLDEDRMEAACQALDTLTEVIQGPCASAQRALMDAKVLDVCTQIMADPFDLAFEGEPDHPLIMDVKEKTITLLISLLEGISSKKTFQTFGEVLEFDVLKTRMAYVYRKCMADAEQDPYSIVDATKVPEDIYFGDLNEAFGLFMLMALLAPHSERARKAILPTEYSAEDRVVVEFFRRNAGCIEIKWEEKLERIYYPIPPICSYLTEASRQRVLWAVNRESPGEKMMDFFTITDDLQAEMIHLEKMSRFKFLAMLSRNFETLKTVMLALAFVINALLLMDVKVSSPTNPEDDISTLYSRIIFTTPAVKWATFGLGCVQTVLTGLITFAVLATNGPLAVDTAWSTKIRLQGKPSEDEPEPEEGSVHQLLRLGPDCGEGSINEGEAGFFAIVVYYYLSLVFLLSDSIVLVHLSYFIMSIAGNILTPFIQAYHLMDLVYRSETLKNVLKAVTFNGTQLLMTALLALIVLYFYAILGFLLMRNNYFLEDFPDVRPCDTLMNCFLSTVREGLLNGGGMADFLPKRSITDTLNFSLRFFFDLSFFVIVIIILLNVIFGIIIDTFAAMREETESKQADMKNNCFICSIDRYTFDRQGTPFEIHIKEEHNMWKYLYYLVYLKTKDATELTGLESYVMNLVEAEDVGFYPVLKASCLDDDEEEEDPFQVDVVEKFEHLNREVAFLKKTILDMKSDGTQQQTAAVDFNKSLMTQIEGLAASQSSIFTELRSANTGI